MVIYSSVIVSLLQLPVTIDFLLSVLSAFYAFITFMHSGKYPASSAGYRLFCFCRSEISNHKGEITNLK